MSNEIKRSAEAVLLEVQNLQQLYSEQNAAGLLTEPGKANLALLDDLLGVGKHYADKTPEFDRIEKLRRLLEKASIQHCSLHLYLRIDGVRLSIGVADSYSSTSLEEVIDVAYSFEFEQS
jgi:hypothetical protein